MKVAIIAGAVVVLGLVAVVAGVGCSALNGEARLRNAITAKQKDNQSEFDNLWKKVSQVAQVAEKDRDSLKDIIIAHAEARTGSGGGGEVMKWVQESVPTVPPDTMRNLQNLIAGSRDSFTQRQKELLDLKREHDNLLTTMPSSWFLGGKSPIDVRIITSNRAEKAMETGKDEDVKVFSK